MNQENNSPQNLIDQVIEMLRQEINSLQIVGRALTPAETKRIELLEQTIGNLEMIMNAPSDDESTAGGSY